MGMSADGPVGRAESSQTADEAQQHIRKNVTISAGRRSNVESPHLSIFFFFFFSVGHSLGPSSLSSLPIRASSA